MNTIEITREFMNEYAEEVKNWELAAEVIFTAWADPEEADKAYSRCLRRAKNWHAKYPDTYIMENEERLTAYNGEIIVTVTVRKHEADLAA